MPGIATVLPEVPWLFDTDEVFAHISGRDDDHAAVLNLAQMCALLSSGPTIARPDDIDAALAVAHGLRNRLPQRRSGQRHPALLGDLPQLREIGTQPILAQSLRLATRGLAGAATAAAPNRKRLAGAVLDAEYVLTALSLLTAVLGMSDPSASRDSR